MRSLTRSIKKNKTLLLMLVPPLVFVIIFSYIPMLGIVVAFKNYNYSSGFLRSPWVGFDNFRYLFVTGKIWALTRNTLLYNISFIFFGIIFEVGFAIILSEITGNIFKKVSQGFIFLPYFISWVVVSTIMLNIFGENGVLNSVLTAFGAEKFSIYQRSSQWPVVMVLVKLWKQTGYGTVVYLAAIAGVSQEMIEAAKIDGASVWQRIRYITIPSIKPTIIIMTLLAIGNIFRGDFGMFYQLVGSNQLLLQSSDVIDTYVYRSLITTPNIGMSAAAGLYQSVLCFVTICAANYIVKKADPDYTLF
ncbi:ABC transporter permease [Clostridium sp. Marseille-P2415]|uniref:ABC transporter permease n=1 Tax=Clostridium sp. Marseille-P2415 TaxID=1805471 RepID=UPI0009887EBD|nr:ABC transporter permease subunit [Clostridium sp. Marseille-P2415]